MFGISVQTCFVFRTWLPWTPAPTRSALRAELHGRFAQLDVLSLFRMKPGVFMMPVDFATRFKVAYLHADTSAKPVRKAHLLGLGEDVRGSRVCELELGCRFQD